MYMNGNIVLQIVVGIVLGAVLAFISPELASKASVLGTLFVKALKAIAPLLVFVLVMASIANHKKSQQTYIKPVLFLYMAGTLIASVTAVVFSFMFPSTLNLLTSNVKQVAPEGISEVLTTLVFNMVDNPVNALVQGNYIGILTWAAAIGFGLGKGSETTKNVLQNLADSVTSVVNIIIRLAPFGIFGLVANTLASTGVEALVDYSHLLLVLISCMQTDP